ARPEPRVLRDLAHLLLDGPACRLVRRLRVAYDSVLRRTQVDREAGLGLAPEHGPERRREPPAALVEHPRHEAVEPEVRWDSAPSRHLGRHGHEGKPARLARRDFVVA